MRVLLLTSGYAPIIGGAETYAQTLAEGLAASGHEVLVVTDQVAGHPASERLGGVRVARLSGYRALLDDPSKLPWEQLYFGVLPELEEVLRGFTPQLVVANNLETTVIGRVVAFELDVPLVGTYHEHAPEEEPFGQGKMALGYRFLSPDLVLAGSRSYQARALRHLPADRVRLIYHGVDTDTFRPDVGGAAVRARYGIAPDEKLVVNSGRLKPRKGQLALLRAFAAQDDPSARLLIVGGVSSASLEHAALLESEIDQLGLRSRVRIDREVTYQQIPAVLAAADVVAQPSTSEGLGLALIEAMAMGRPVIATNIPGFDEILTADGLALVVEPDDVDGLAAALRTMLADPGARARLAAAGHQHAVEHFSRKKMLEHTEAALLEVVRS
ncbi:MAG: hypothetical protein QOF58_1102 [Pseudonocardiales bacterium]|nr:hypothetical protein [Pseudonocardiales bacterium]